MGGWQQKKHEISSNLSLFHSLLGSEISGPGFYQTVRGVGSVFRLGSEVKAGSEPRGVIEPILGESKLIHIYGNLEGFPVK